MLRFVFVFVALSTVTGCSGANSLITANDIDYPVSMTGTLLDGQGEKFQPARSTGGHFEFGWTNWSMLWTLIPVGRQHDDISTQLRSHVETRGGDAVVNLKVSVTNNWYWLFAALIPIIPSYVSIDVEGDVVRTDRRWERGPDAPNA